MSVSNDDLKWLNDLVWHVSQVQRIANELNRNGVSDTEIEVFLKEYKPPLERTP